VPVPYVVRFVSARSGAGKTATASLLVRELRARGYRVGVVKHAASSVSLEEKDSKKYLESGAETVVVSSSGLALVYVRGHRDLLEDAVVYAKTPIVVVEGFRESSLGDVVVVASSESEVEELLARGVKPLVVVHTDESPVDQGALGVRVVKPSSIRELVELVETRVLEHYLQQTPRLDCGKCGYATCRELVEAYTRGAASWCPVASGGTSLVVDGVEIPLNPFVKNTIKSVVKGLISVLKGVPPEWSRVVVTVSRED
jgi:molybdopterin-guanine dinucleotide biosynthesis protein MobB